MSHGDITQALVNAWDDDPEEEVPSPAAQIEPEPEPEPAPEEPETEEEEETEVEAEAEPIEEEEPEEEQPPPEEPEEGEEGEEGEEEEEEEEVEPEGLQIFEQEDGDIYETTDTEIAAYLSKYQGNVDRALKGAARMQRALSREGQERVALARRVTELETELETANAFSSLGSPLSEEQRNWVVEATESGNPALYVQQAVRANEFELARAVCDAWAEEDSYSAMRAARFVDGAEARAQSFVDEPVPLDHGALMSVLTEHYPEMVQYEPQMVQTLQALGDAHPLVEDARSSDPETAARGIIGIFEIARAQTATLSGARAKVRNEQRENAENARRRAVVSSAQTAPAPSQTTRPTSLGPGLTLEELDAEWARK